MGWSAAKQSPQTRCGSFSRHASGTIARRLVHSSQKMSPQSRHCKGTIGVCSKG